MNAQGVLANRHSHITIILLSVVVGAVLAGVVLYYPSAHPAATAQDTGRAVAAARGFENAFVGIADQTLPAVASISVETTGEAGNADDFDQFFKENPFFEPFFKDFKRGGKNQPQQRARPHGHSLGSGWVYREDGYIVTNSHVVRGADKITVKLHDRQGDEKEYEAKLVGTDPKTELAVIKIDPGRKLPTLKLGNSGVTKVGQWVMAVGAPFQLEQTVTVGVISAKGRFLPGQSKYIRIGDIIQTDASINPGNSGGPLVNLDGEVVGINVAIVSNGATPGNVGIGFAIPADTAKLVIPQLVQDRKVARGWLGITIAELNDNSRDFFGVKEGGIIVEDITADGPAAKTDLKVQDIVVAIDGEKIADTWEFQKAVASRRPGVDIMLDVVRDHKPLRVKIKLGEMPGKYAGADEPQVAEKPTETSALGITLEPLNAELAAALGTNRTSGLVVTAVDPEGPAADKLDKGDIITGINRSTIKTADDYKKALAEAKRSGKQYIMVFYERKVDRDWTRSHIDMEPKW